jgi:hypothetical protein
VHTLARWFLSEYGNAKNPEKQDAAIFYWVSALRILGERGCSTVEAARLFARARLDNGGKPLFKAEVNRVPPMFQQRRIGQSATYVPRATSGPPERERSPRRGLDYDVGFVAEVRQAPGTPRSAVAE